MTRRRLLCLGGLGILGLGAGVSAVLLAPDRITPASCERVRIGMAKSEVEAILGRAPDMPGLNFLAPRPGAEPSEEWVWLGRRWVIVVQYDASGAVCNRACGPAEAFSSLYPWSRFRERLRETLSSLPGPGRR